MRPTPKKRVHFLLPFIPAQYTLPTQDQLDKLNDAAKEAAFKGKRELAEYYRAQGASLDSIAFAVGISGDWDYAEFLATQNPQALNLKIEMAVGFRLNGQRSCAEKLIQMGADKDIVNDRYRNRRNYTNALPKEKIISKDKRFTVLPPLGVNQAYQRKLTLPHEPTLKSALKSRGGFFQAKCENSEELFSTTPLEKGDR